LPLEESEHQNGRRLHGDRFLVPLIWRCAALRCAASSFELKSGWLGELFRFFDFIGGSTFHAT
jgi:hypothetical protein